MSKKVFGVIAVIAVFVSIYLWNEDKKTKKRIVKLEDDRLKLIMESIQANRDLTEETKKQLREIAKEFEKIDARVSSELVQALQLFQIGQKENAIEDLVKIIEHLLHKTYDDHKPFMKWLKEVKMVNNLHSLLEYCRVDKKITAVEHKFFVALKEIRNREDHILDFELDDHLSAAGLVIGLKGIIKLSKFAYPAK